MLKSLKLLLMHRITKQKKWLERILQSLQAISFVFEKNRSYITDTDVAYKLTFR